MLKNQSFVVRGAVLAGALAASTITAAPAFANPPAPTTTNNASVTIRGGDATALAACVNYAHVASKHHRKVTQKNYCDNFAAADGGNVTLTHVKIRVVQSGSTSGTTSNNATVSISGGDATAVAACLNVLQGTASAKQVNVCSNDAVATGGDVTLDHTKITIYQS